MNFKNLITATTCFLLLITISCSKENDSPTIDENSTENSIDLPTAQHVEIHAARISNNEAIKAHDAPRVASIYTQDFFILTSTNGLFTGKDEVGNIYQSVFDSRSDVLFVRTPKEISVNEEWNMAAEVGNWVGTWKVDDVNIEVSGSYYAKWHKIDMVWKLRCEVYTQLECQGAVVCENLPDLGM